MATVNSKKQILYNIDTLVTMTASGKVNWKQQNPSTYFYESKLTDDNKYITSIQKVLSAREYVFQIIDERTKDSILKLTAKTNEQGSSSLYHSATSILETLQKIESAKAVKPDPYTVEVEKLLEKLYRTVENFINERAASIFNDILQNVIPKE
ncbi:hypothetical protein [Spirosoma aerolatum]|uniref:hypothetical protein n=1 Tax=Spirosoma aerolatum TaxID=1211326 RepID=UPI0009ACFA49|nr:hypothetical protein [Spirosoma aerolatum]